MTNKNYLQQYISQKVKYFRTQKKMSQEELSEQAGLGLKYINQLENQNVNLTIHSLEKVIVALKMTPEEFFNFDSLESTSDKTDNFSLKRINMKVKQLPIDKREKMLVIFESILDNL
ncbi:helix-turn-helix domain-containing protein [Streptococcus infantis]|uniref:helix-turn-helix domain-containing protein n=1 Tax=Streptococcus infantis TaxID=68892 RepID=UPI0039C28A46